MVNARKWLVMSGALALGAGAAVGVTGDLGRDQQSVGPGVTLNPVATSSAVPGDDIATILVTADDADVSAQSPASPVSADSPASPDTVSPASPVSVDSPDSPASPDSAD